MRVKKDTSFDSLDEAMCLSQGSFFSRSDDLTWGSANRYGE
jgi:hypothetical protein